MPEAAPTSIGRPVVDPALLLDALARLRAAAGSAEAAVTGRGFAVTRAVDPSLRPAVPRPAVRTVPGARAGTPVLVPTGLAALLNSGYSAREETARADRSTAEPNQSPFRPT